MTINWRNSLWYTCSFPIGLQDAATRRVFSRGFTKKNGACSLDCFTYKSSSSANMSSSLVFHGLFACFPSPFIDGVSWIKYFKRVFVFDVGISGQFFLSFALQRVRHPGEKEDIQQLQQVWQHLTNHVRLHEPITSRQNWPIRSSNDQNPNSDIWQTVVSQCPRGPSFSFCLKNLRPEKRGKNIVLAPHWSKNRKRKKKIQKEHVHLTHFPYANLNEHDSNIEILNDNPGFKLFTTSRTTNLEKHVQVNFFRLLVLNTSWSFSVLTIDPSVFSPYFSFFVVVVVDVLP